MPIHMPNLVQEFKVEVGKPLSPSTQLELKITPWKIGLRTDQVLTWFISLLLWLINQD